jgi:FkbM family methyltransferase
MKFFSRAASAFLRRAIVWQALKLDYRNRARVVEQLSDQTITAVPVAGGQLVFHTPSQLLISRAESLLSKEADTIQWIDGFDKGAVFWDVGANVGVYSLYAARQRQASVVAFEPLAPNYFVLTRNIQSNRLSEQVRAYCLALCGESKLGVLNTPAPAMGVAISQFGACGEVSRYYEGGSEISTQGTFGMSIDDFAAQFHPPFPNHLKIDVDGIELPILTGASNVLGDPRLKSVMVELNVSHQDEYRAANRLLAKSGFQLLSKGERQGTETEIAMNHLFRRS